jgi:hypothetical protein
MCKRGDSIQLVSDAADRLAQICERELHGLADPSRIDPTHPGSAGTAQALRSAIRDVSTTPLDMAELLGRIK